MKKSSGDSRFAVIVFAQKSDYTSRVGRFAPATRTGNAHVKIGLLLSYWGWDDEHVFGFAVVAVMVYLVTSFRRPSRRCPRCKEINRDQARFCAQCGTQLPNR